MVRLVLRVSPLAKAAVTVALIGGALGVYGRLDDVAWAMAVGTVLLFAGAIVWYVERYRMYRKKRSS